MRKMEDEMMIVASKQAASKDVTHILIFPQFYFRKNVFFFSFSLLHFHSTDVSGRVSLLTVNIVDACGVLHTISYIESSMGSRREVEVE